MTIVNDPQQRRVGEVIQGMAKEAGFNISLRPAEFASALNDDDAGKLQAFLIGWSGRVDPDANIHQFQTCGGQPQHDAGVRRGRRRAPEQGARGQRPGAAHGALPRGRRQVRRVSGATSSTSTT